MKSNTLLASVLGITTVGVTVAAELGNQPPVCTPGLNIVLWPPNHQYHEIDFYTFAGAIDPDGDSLDYVITAITQDEPLNSNGDGNTTCDGLGVGESLALIRAERLGGGNG